MGNAPSGRAARRQGRAAGPRPGDMTHVPVTTGAKAVGKRITAVHQGRGRSRPWVSKAGGVDDGSGGSVEDVMKSPALAAVGRFVARAAEPIVAMPLDGAGAAFQRFVKDSFVRENAGAVNGAVLERMLGQGGAPALRLLELFDGTGRRLPGTAVDGFEVLAAAVTCCRSSPAARAKLLFEMFDLDANGALSHPELVVLIKCVLVGVARVTHGRPPPLPALRAFARDAFESADLVADGKLSYAEFSSWVRNCSEARALLRLFPASGRPLLPWEPVEGVDSPLSPTRRMTHSSRVRGVDRIIQRLEAESGPGAGGAAARLGGTGHEKRVGLFYSPTARAMSSAYQRQVLAGEKEGEENGGAAAPPVSPPAATDGRDAQGAGAPPEKRGKRGGSSRASDSGSAKRGTPFVGRFRKQDVLSVVDRFRAMDDDRSGSVSVLEFAREMKGDSAAASAMFQTMDRDNSGDISLEELLQLWYSGATPQEWQQILVWAGLKSSGEEDGKGDAGRLTDEQREELRAVFNAFDEDGDGILPIPGLLRRLAESDLMPETEARALLEEADVDHSDSLDFDEFVELMDKLFVDAVSALMQTRPDRRYRTP